MKSTAQVAGHPIHPMLIPYPFALLSAGAAFDVAANLTGRREWAQTAEHMTIAGIGSALVAAVPGVIDYFGSVPSGRVGRHATTHALCNLSAVGCLAVANSQRDRRGTLSGGGLALSLLGVALLSIGGYLGGELVYGDRVGIPGPDDERRLPAGQDRRNDQRDMLS